MWCSSCCVSSYLLFVIALPLCHTIYCLTYNLLCDIPITVWNPMLRPAEVSLKHGRRLAACVTSSSESKTPSAMTDLRSDRVQDTLLIVFAHQMLATLRPWSNFWANQHLLTTSVLRFCTALGGSCTGVRKWPTPARRYSRTASLRFWHMGRAVVLSTSTWLTAVPILAGQQVSFCAAAVQFLLPANWNQAEGSGVVLSTSTWLPVVPTLPERHFSFCVVAVAS